MKRLIIVLFIFTVKIGLAKEVTIDNINYFLKPNLTAIVIKGKYSGNISVPEIINYQNKNYTVEEIGYEAFVNSKELISVELPATIKIIGGRAFENCIELKSVNIPSSVINIQQAVFFKCRKITALHLPEKVESIGEFAFSLCESLESITVDENNKHFSSLNDVLYDKDLKTLIKVPETKTHYVFPDTVEEFLMGSFENCKYLTSLEIPEKIKIIPQSAFDFCSALTKINIHKNIERIGLFAFSNCKSLQSITVDKDNKHYSSVDGVLYNFDKTILIRFPASKPNVTLEKTIEKIESHAFTYCQKLEELTIPENVKTIGWAAFAQSHSLKNVKIMSKEMVSFHSGAFTTIKNNVTIWVPKEIIEAYQKSNSLEVKELNYKSY